MSDRDTTSRAPEEKKGLLSFGSRTFLSQWGERQNPAIQRFILLGIGALFLLSVVLILRGRS